MRKPKMIALMVAMMLVGAACGGDSDNVTVKDGGEVVVHLDEYSFTPGTIQVTAGSTVTFVIRNEGQLKHEFMVGRTVRVTDGVKDGFEEDFFHDLDPVVVPADAVMDMEAMDMGDMGDMGDEHGFMIERPSGEEASITITVPSDAVGEWEYGCFVDDGKHYEKGMQGTLIVVAG